MYFKPSCDFRVFVKLSNRENIWWWDLNLLPCLFHFCHVSVREPVLGLTVSRSLRSQGFRVEQSRRILDFLNWIQSRGFRLRVDWGFAAIHLSTYRRTCVPNAECEVEGGKGKTINSLSVLAFNPQHKIMIKFNFIRVCRAEKIKISALELG